MSLINVYCETCREHVAIVDTDELVFPAVGSMFKSPDEKHGIAQPFEAHPWAGWEMMFCPHGRMHRISEGPDYIVTEGMAKYQIPKYQEVVERAKSKKQEEGSEEASSEREEVVLTVQHEANIVDNREIYEAKVEVAPIEVAPVNNSHLCRICGKICKNAMGLKSHMKSHKPGELK